MQYDVIIIGATFLSAGLAEIYKDRCLVIERRPQAGYEVFNAASFGSSYSSAPSSDEAKRLYEHFREKGAFRGGRVCLFDCASAFYSCLEDKNIMLGMEIVDICRKGEGFEVTVHGVSGYRTYKAETVIDTTIHKEMIAGKSLNAFINTDEELPSDIPQIDGVETVNNRGYEGEILIKCKLSSEETYIGARKALLATIEKLPPRIQNLLCG